MEGRGTELCILGLPELHPDFGFHDDQTEGGELGPLAVTLVIHSSPFFFARQVKAKAGKQCD